MASRREDSQVVAWGARNTLASITAIFNDKSNVPHTERIA
jgi:hypothetical protein